MDEELLRTLFLSLYLLKGFGPISYKKIIEYYENYENLAINYKSGELEKLLNVKLDINQVRTLQQKILNKGISVKYLFEKDFPENLKEIYDSPYLLFYKGHFNYELINNSISIVGTRKCTSYGVRETKNMISGLFGFIPTIVSGMAMGIDREAHLSALNLSMYTVAVLAGSVESPTPLNNSFLYKRIIDEGGLILSECAPGSTISKGSFIARNRIIAGLSRACIVVEAGETSGALSTAHLAFNYNRDVFSIPGCNGLPQSFGTNSIIKKGIAKIIQNSEDVLYELGYGKVTRENSLATLPADTLSEEEIKVYHFLKSGPKLANEISNFLNLEISAIMSSCSLLELKGIILKNEKGEYSIN